MTTAGGRAAEAAPTGAVAAGELAPSCDHGEHCITCGDEALPLRVVAVDTSRELALCAAADGRRESVEIALVAPVAPGDVLLVHAGTAIAHAAPEGGRA